MLGVPTDKLGVHMYKSYEDVIYVSTTLVAHGPCTHGSYLAGAEYFREADCSTVLYGNSIQVVPGIQQAQQNARRNCLESRESTPVSSGLWSIFYVLWYRAVRLCRTLYVYLCRTTALLYKKNRNGDPDHKMEISLYQLSPLRIPVTFSSSIT